MRDKTAMMFKHQLQNSQTVECSDEAKPNNNYCPLTKYEHPVNKVNWLLSSLNPVSVVAVFVYIY